MPLVSVVIPTYNGAKYITRAVYGILNQTFTDFELLIIDDGSTDNTLEVLSVIKDSRIRVYQNDQNRGVAYTRNRGIELARGDFLAVNDVDDYSYPQRLEMQIKFLLSHPSYWAVGASAKRIKQDRRHNIWEYPKNDEEIRCRLFWGASFVNSTALFNLLRLKQNGLCYSLEFEVAEDYDLFEKISRIGKLANIDEILIEYQVRNDGLTLSKDKLMKKSAFSICLRQIEHLDVQLTEVEEELFFKLYTYTFDFSESEVYTLISLSEELTYANSAKKYYKEDVFNALLAKRVFEANYHSPLVMSLKPYRKSSLSAYYSVSESNSLRKRIKSILKLGD